MSVKPEGKLKEELVEELVKKEREIAREEEKKKTATRVANGRIQALEERRDEILDLLEGRENIQPQLPLTSPAKNGKKPEPPALKWTKEGGNEVAHVEGFGTYCVELGIGGKYDVLFTPPGGRSKTIGSAPVPAEAKDVARRDLLAAAADGILENAGAGALTAKGRRKIAKQGGERPSPA